MGFGSLLFFTLSRVVLVWLRGGSPGGTDQPPIKWQDRENSYNSVAPAYPYDSGWNYENLSMRYNVDGIVFSDLPIGDDNAYGESPKLPKEIALKDPKANSTLSIVQKFKGMIGKLLDEVEQMLDLNTGPTSESPNRSSADTISSSSNGLDGSGHSGEPSSSGDGSPEGTADSKPSSKGSTGRTQPNNLNEQLAMKQVKSNPQAGQVLPIKMTDPRWPASDGWVKMQQVVKINDGSKITIHYVYNTNTGTADDFKFK